MAELIIKRAGGPLLRRPLKDGIAIIGRDPKCDVVLASTFVSRQHAQIESAGELAAIVDLESRNGVLINGAQLRGRHVLRRGDELEDRKSRTTETWDGFKSGSLFLMLDKACDYGDRIAAEDCRTYAPMFRNQGCSASLDYVSRQQIRGTITCTIGGKWDEVQPVHASFSMLRKADHFLTLSRAGVDPPEHLPGTSMKSVAIAPPGSQFYYSIELMATPIGYMAQ